jgi:hypothetical protein
MATATERKVIGMEVEDRLKLIKETIDEAKKAFERSDIKTMQALLLKAYTLGSQL